MASGRSGVRLPSAPPISTPFFVYVLRSEASGRYYIGSTKNLVQRLAQHNAGMMRATRSHRPWRLAYSAPYPTLAQARRREMEIKGWKNPAYMERALGLADA